MADPKLPMRVLIVDDHAVVRHGIRMVLEAEPDIEVVGEAGDGEDALALVASLRPDVVVMDIGLPTMNGIEATQRIRTRHPTVQVLGLTMHEDEAYVRRLLAAGAAGYVVKRAAATALVAAVRHVAAGQAFLDPAVTRTVIEGYARKQSGEPELLTPREQEVLILAAQGASNADIARRLHISIKTVQTHRTHIMEKLDLHDRTDLVRYAIRKGWVEP